jgi:hypothetical protein
MTTGIAVDVGIVIIILQLMLMIGVVSLSFYKDCRMLQSWSCQLLLKWHWWKKGL